MKEVKIVTVRQKRFCDEYLIDQNATQAAIRAGYSKKTARSIGQRLLTYVDIKEKIKSELNKIHNKNIADATEVMEYLTSVLRGESQSEMVVIEGVGEGRSEAKKIKKAPDEKERLKAADIFAKIHGLSKDCITLEVDPITIVNDLKE